MSQRSRILLLIPHLGGGGAEQVTALLARGLSPSKYELHLGLVTQAESGDSSLPSWVTIHSLRASRVRAGALPLLRLVRRLKPNLIFSGMAHLNFLVLLLRPLFPRGVRVVVRQNATVSSALAFGGLPGYTRLLYRLLYRHADRIICQTRAMADDLAAELAIEKDLIAVLPNPVDIDAIRAVASAAEDAAIHNPIQRSGPGPHLVAMGRLSREKGFDLLLSAFAEVRERFPGADLLIAGAGPEEAALKAQCSALRLDSMVRFAGFVSRPWVHFRGAVFVLPSRHEGMPNALLEAAAAGLPIVALPASAGVVELLQDRPGVWLAPEVSAAALAASLLAALQNLPPGARFDHAFIREFSFESAIQAYEDLIDATIEGRR